MTDKHGKERVIRDFMAEQGVDTLLLQKVSSFAWATDGAASYVSTAAENGEASLLFTPDKRYVITNNIEALRLTKEERLQEKGWEVLAKDWYQERDLVTELNQGSRFGADGSYGDAVDLSNQLARIRVNLTPEEGDRLREVGAVCARAMEAVAVQIRPGMTDFQIAALLGKEMQSEAVYPIVQQVAVDERSLSIRHAIPAGRTLAKYAVIALCGRRDGLVASMTRSVHLGPIPEQLAVKHQQTGGVDAALIAATRPGAVLKDVFAQAQQAYADAGYPDEWRHHHQGGTAGYEPREYLGSPTATEVVGEGQAFAWNPTIAGNTIAGAKSEDTILVGKDTNEVITRTNGWPMLTYEIDGRTIERPGILEI